MTSANLSGQKNNADILQKAVVDNGINQMFADGRPEEAKNQNAVAQKWELDPHESPTETNVQLSAFFENELIVISPGEMADLLDGDGSSNIGQPPNNVERELNTPTLEMVDPEHLMQKENVQVSSNLQRDVGLQNHQLIEVPIVHVPPHLPELQLQDHQNKPQDNEGQAMLDPHFAPSQYVVRENGENAPETIKIDHLCKLNLSQREIEDQTVLIAIIHSHPDFVQHTIKGSNVEEIAPNATPFIIKHPNVTYQDVQIPSMNMVMKGAVVSLKKEKSIFIKFLIFSTDERNHGSNKDGKEWHLIVIPLSKVRAEVIQQSTENPPALTLDDINPMSFLRIQVKTEARKNSKRVKPHRRVEVEWPFTQTQERQRLEKLYIRSKKRKVSQMTDEELKAKIAKLEEYQLCPP